MGSVAATVGKFGALTGRALRTARAYRRAGTMTARRRVLDEFASGEHRSA